ncbi:RNA polymerase sigma factor [Streptomyces chartreusis]|uniref:RNA polymerase sigma factor n=1 Tax=Streptomyces chartreusis TaxID=1969 RepID=UPI0034273C28
MTADRPSNNDSDKESAFEDLFRAEFKTTVRHLLFLGASVPEATDAVQEGFTLLWTRWDEVRAPRAWLRTTSFHSWMRSTVKQNNVISTDSDVALEEVMPPAPDDPWVEARDQLELREVRALLDQLPIMQRRALSLHVSGLNTREIALELSVNEATVRSHIRHGRKRLSSLIATKEETMTPGT